MNTLWLVPIAALLIAMVCVMVDDIGFWATVACWVIAIVVTYCAARGTAA